MGLNLNPIELALVGLTEERSEVVQVLCKIKRFGLDTLDPTDGESARLKLAKEVGDLLGCIDLLRLHVVLDADVIRHHRAEKPGKLLRLNAERADG